MKCITMTIYRKTVRLLMMTLRGILQLTLAIPTCLTLLLQAIIFAPFRLIKMRKERLKRNKFYKSQSNLWTQANNPYPNDEPLDLDKYGF